MTNGGAFLRREAGQQRSGSALSEMWPVKGKPGKKEEMGYDVKRKSEGGYGAQEAGSDTGGL